MGNTPLAAAPVYLILQMVHKRGGGRNADRVATIMANTAGVEYTRNDLARREQLPPGTARGDRQAHVRNHCADQMQAVFECREEQAVLDCREDFKSDCRERMAA